MTERRPLNARQQQLLARELERRRATAVRPIVPRPTHEPPTLSLAQRRLWFLDRLHPGQSTYNATMTMRMEGPLDEDALHLALDLVVRRHEALRTVGVDVNGQPVGRLLDAGVRWRSRAVDPSELEISLTADAREPFDLSSDVMLRASLYTLSAMEHILILVIHHIACDGWSRGVLFSEIAEIYNATVQGRTPKLPQLRVQYGDYAKWQLEQVAAGAVRRSDDFWRKELEGADFVTELPTDFPRPRKQDHRGGRVAMDGTPRSGDALRELARHGRATFFMAMMAVTGTFISGLSGQDDVILGSPVANRSQPELEGLIGFFVNTVLLRVRLAGDPSFRELLSRCRASALASLAHQETPLDRVVELVNPRRTPGRNPLFQVNFRMQGAAPPPPQLDGMVVSRMLTETGAARFDLALGLNDQPGAVRGYVEYSAGLFRASTAQAMQMTFTRLVDQVVTEPDAPVSALTRLVAQQFEEQKQELRSAETPRSRAIRARR